MSKVSFELKSGTTRVEVAVQHLDETVVVTDSGVSTDDPAVIAQLDATEGVKRASGRAPAGDKPQPSADEGGS